MSRDLPELTSRPFKWNDKKRRAVQLLAEGQMKVVDIAAEVGVSRQMLWQWQQVPEFDAEYKRIDRQLDQDLYQQGLAKQRNRVEKLDEHAEWLGRVAKLAYDPAMAREYRAYLKQIAEERGHIGANRHDDRQAPEAFVEVPVTRIFFHQRPTPEPPVGDASDVYVGTDDGSKVGVKEAALARIEALNSERDNRTREVNRQMLKSRESYDDDGIEEWSPDQED